MQKKINEVLTDFFCELHSIDKNKNYDIEYVKARTLLTAHRLDLLPKLRWIHAEETGIGREFAEYLYGQHIKAITARTMKEAGKEDQKNSLDAFRKVFRTLLNLKDGTFNENISVIPVDMNNVIMDGAHRTSVGIYYDLEVPIIRLNKNYPHVDVEFWKSNLMDTELIEIIISDYCKIAPNNVYAICLWPRAEGKKKREQVERLIESVTHILYKKEINVTQKALENLMLQIYRRCDWIGDAKNHFYGASVKANCCFAVNSSAIFYFVEGPELKEILKLKREIRNIFDVSYESVHITDNNNETIDVANIILNKNSLDLVMNGTPNKYKKLNLEIEQFKEMILKEGKNLDDFAIESSAVLGVYGLREPKDLDYIYQNEDIKSNRNNIDYHGQYLKYYNTSLDNLLNDPRNYLYYCGVKFISLDRIREFKKNRGESKDLLDIRLIDSFRKNEFNIKLYLAKWRYDFNRYSNFYIRKIKDKIKKNKYIMSIYYFFKQFFVKG